jgi:hypothetical protein
VRNRERAESDKDPVESLREEGHGTSSPEARVTMALASQNDGPCFADKKKASARSACLLNSFRGARYAHYTPEARFRLRNPATPSRPEPSRSRLEGSGSGVIINRRY